MLAFQVHFFLSISKVNFNIIEPTIYVMVYYLVVYYYSKHIFPCH